MELFYENNNDRYKFSTFRNMSFPAHLHSDLECIWLKEGELTVTVNHCIHTLTAGEIFLAFPHQIHQYRTAPEKSCQGNLIICPGAACGDFRQTLTQNHPEYPFLPADLVHPDVTFAIQSLVQSAPEIHKLLPVIHAYMQLLLARTLPLLALTKNRDSQPPSQTTLLVQYLSEHFTESVSLDALAERLHVSKYCVSRIFSEKLHTSFSRYINTLRIDLAKSLLLESDSDILTISERCGYDTPRTFNREFRSLCGCSPREFRKNEPAEL